jgi:hypothetical protein
VAGVRKSHVGGGARWSAVQRRAIGGSVADMGKSCVGEGVARRSVVRMKTRRRGGVAEEEGLLHRESSHGGEGEKGEGVGRRPDEVEKWPPAARVRSESGVGLLG